MAQTYCITSALEAIRACQNRIVVVQGGTAAGKTVAILILLINYAIENEKKVVSVISDTFPNLRTGALRDFLNICEAVGLKDLCEWNKTSSTMTFPNGSVIEFYSVDTMGALGARRDILFVNEANRVPYDTFSNLEVRTREKIYIDFNPVNEFWAHRELLSRPDVDFLKLTYIDNEGLDQNTIDAIEMRKGDGTSNWWRVYGLGEIGSLEGNIYSGWKPYDLTTDMKLVRYGLDFGFSNDETALVAVYESTSKQGELPALFIRQLIYETGILGSEYCQKLKDCEVDPTVLIVADSARPEIIAEIRNGGFRIVGADKNPGSVKRGIDRVMARQILYQGKDIEREFLTYSWRTKRTGEILDEPEDGNDHLMDAIRYAIDDLSRKRFDF